MKTCIVIGHNRFKKGANSQYFNRTEFTFFETWAAKYSKYPVFINLPLPYQEQCEKTALKTVDYDLVIELHFNAYNGLVHGCETVCNKDNQRMIALSDHFNKLMSEHGFSARDGVRVDLKKYKQTRGGGFIKATKGDAIILEPFFGDNSEDCKRFDKLGMKGFFNIIDKLVEYYEKA